MTEEAMNSRDITQADRDAAAPFTGSWEGPLERDRDRVRRGHCDGNPLVQAFAKHRSQARIEEREAVVRWLQKEADLRRAENAAASPATPPLTLNYNSQRATALEMAINAFNRGDHIPVSDDKEQET